MVRRHLAELVDSGKFDFAQTCKAEDKRLSPSCCHRGIWAVEPEVYLFALGRPNIGPGDLGLQLAIGEHLGLACGG
jgi:3-methyladenine DNA glycosylase/8-oxoguanine DNA glycosylase